MEDSRPSTAFQTVLIALVVVRNKEGLFAATHEHDGWYLPAGRYVLFVAL